MSGKNVWDAISTLYDSGYEPLRHNVNIRYVAYRANTL